MSRSPHTREPRRLRSFLTLFGVQTVGAAIIYWNVLPLYRLAVAGAKPLQVEFEASIWPLAAIALIQSGYWISRRIQPPLPQYTNALLGLCLLFFARMGFVLPTSIFGFVFVSQKYNFQIPAFRYAIILAGLFSLYCYLQDFERLGRSFLGRKPDQDTN
jgi:hypothetical protein